MLRESFCGDDVCPIVNGTCNKQLETSAYGQFCVPLSIVASSDDLAGLLA